MINEGNIYLALATQPLNPAESTANAAHDNGMPLQAEFLAYGN